MEKEQYMSVDIGSQQYDRMLRTPIPKLIVSMAAPSIGSHLISVIYNTADTYFVSQISTSASAAVGVSFALMSLIQSLGFGLGMGCGSLVSRRLGEQKTEEAECYAASAFLATLVVGILIEIFGLLWLEPLMRLLGATDTILPHACAYAKYILLGAPIMCTSFIFNCVLRSEGAAKLALVGITIGGFLNMALDPLLIFRFGMGTAGAALATLISQCVSFVLLAGMFFRGKSIVRLRPRAISWKLTTYLEIFTTGFPTICRQGLASVASACLNASAAVYGDAAVAAISIANRLYLLVKTVISGLGQGFQPVAGYNYGAGDYVRTKKAFSFTVKLGSALCILFAAGLAVFAEPIIRWFRNDPAVIEIGRVSLLYCCAVIPFMAYSTFVNQMLQSLGRRIPATFLASCRQGIFFLPLIYLLPPVLHLTGVQLAQPCADLLTFFISIPFQIWFFHKVLNR